MTMGLLDAARWLTRAAAAMVLIALVMTALSLLLGTLVPPGSLVSHFAQQIGKCLSCISSNLT
jgi:hypothetical protein